jgi:hypothetical protein
MRTTHQNQHALLSAEDTANETSADEAAPATAWTQEIFDGIDVAELNIGADGSMSYSGGSKFSELVSKVGDPDSTSESTIAGTTTVIAIWSKVSWTGGDSQVITLSYDKDSDEITSKSMTNF